MIDRAFLELARLRRNQWLDTVQLERIQFGKLKKLLRHAYENVPYYHRLFDSVGVKPDDVESLDDFQRIPITTKDQLQSLPIDQIVAQGAHLERCLERRTSGSTGMPLTIYVTPEEKLFQTLISLRILRENDLRFSDRLAYIGDPRHFVSQNRWFQRLGILRRINISVFEDPEEQVRVLQKSKPNVLYGYASSLTLLAEALKAAQVAFPLPKLVFSTAEPLTSRGRYLIESVFGQVRDVYGTVEFGDIAWECARHEGYHINMDYLVVEVLREGRRAEPGQAGELVCTSLHSYVMPLIRYRVGDMCTMSAARCSCGRGLPLMELVEGRLVDLIRLPSGRSILPSVLIVTIGEIPGIRQFQIVQETLTSIVIRIIPDAGFSRTTLVQVEARCNSIVAQEVQITVEVVDSLPLEPSGKFSVVKSKVQQDTQ